MRFLCATRLIVTASNKEILETIKHLITNFLRERGLELSPEKTCITHIENGFDFLGQNIRKYKSKLTTKPAKKNIKAFLRKVRGIIKEYKTATVDNLIKMLNPVIRGWTNYHRHATARKTFSYVDNRIWHALWKWAKRRHHNKSVTWIKKKYFLSKYGRNWIFGTNLSELVSACKTRITLHIKVKCSFNPYEKCVPHNP
ncbi:MAG: hypothetical protein H7844_16015 [Nitrospirae bacterium YQR-1]